MTSCVGFEVSSAETAIGTSEATKTKSSLGEWALILMCAIIELLLQESCNRFVCAKPGSMQGKVVRFVRKYDFLVRHVLVFQACRQINHLLKRYVPIVVTVDQQHRRPPVRYVGDRR